jgi:hypothetical protein
LKKLNKIGYMVFYGGGIVLSNLLNILAVADGSKGNTQVGYLWLALNLIVSLVYGVVFLVFIYRIWEYIPQEIARTTPGKAVGYQFIPFFQFYWIFKVFLGWAKDWNKFVQGDHDGSKTMSEGLAVAIPLMILVSLGAGLVIYTIGKLTWLSILLGTISGFLGLLYMNKVCDLVNDKQFEHIRVGVVKEELPDEYQVHHGSVRGVWSLVLGCISIPSIFIPQYFGVLFGPACAIIAIVLARRELRLNKESVPVIGLVTGILGAVLWAMMIITLAVMLIQVYA